MSLIFLFLWLLKLGIYGAFQDSRGKVTRTIEPLEDREAIRSPKLMRRGITGDLQHDCQVILE